MLAPTGETKMMNLGTQTGSLVNHILSRESVVPQIGMGATLLSWSDRTPATVIDWDAKKKLVTVQIDNYTRIDTNGMSESQDYEYTANPDGAIYRYKWIDGKGWVCMVKNPETGRLIQSKCGGLTVGRRERFYDFSF